MIASGYTYARVGLHRFWGTGESASADGMKWDVHPESLKNLVPRIRYGGYGGIGYYLVSDTYIALFSRFLACGAYEGHAILDFVAENRSLLQPSTIHSDTHGQSAAIFGLAYLLGIELMPRIRTGRTCTCSDPTWARTTSTSIACSPPPWTGR